ncbi:MAG TPA: hypothetical protein PKD64_11885 [Pirellulaceae bacterium]|nr:hypothetical protein [Pirellulaceae bacterium]HMO92885.1 hypothetical protein [Pirellulaceae bacterium]HMP69164.1 hypothetical protein [Pirellulaceae bacterium]
MIHKSFLQRRTLLKWVPATLAFGGLGGLRLPSLNAQPFTGLLNHSTETVTPESEAAVRKALEWLRRVQNSDGGCGVDKGTSSDIGCTAMTGLAFMAHGSTPYEGPNKNQLRELRKYIIRQTDSMPQNDITNQTGTQLQNKIGRHAHSFFAALFLSQLVGEEANTESTLTALRKVVTAIVRSQQNGHWGNQSWAPTLGTVMGWVSLRAAGFAGLTVGAAPEKTAEHLIREMRQNLGTSQGWMHDLYKKATGIRVLYEMGRDSEDIARKAFADVLNLVTKDNTPFSQAGGEEYLAFHLITETMLQKGGDDWNKWFSVVRDKIVNVQNSDGSWTGHHCITSRTFCTAAAVLVLTSPYRYLPISQG